MRYILLVLLGLSLPVLADQGSSQQSLPKDLKIEPGCDPHETTKMLDFN